MSGDGGSKDISAIDILTKSVSEARCSECNLASNLQKAAAANRGTKSFAEYLCDQYHPVDIGPKGDGASDSGPGICCLRECRAGGAREHSIRDFCAGNRRDLMSEKTLDDECGGDPADYGRSQSSEANTLTSSVEAAATSTDDSSTMEETTSPSSESAPSSSFSSSVSPGKTVANGAAQATGTSTAPTARATSSTGAALGQRMAVADRLNTLGLALLPILAIF